MIVIFNTIPESKILDTGDILIQSNLKKPWMIVCKDVDRIFELEYSTCQILNRSELCECSLTAGNYLLSQTASNFGDMPEAKDGFFTAYYAFNKIVLDMLMEKFNIRVDDDTVTQLALLHSDIPGYDLPALDFVSPPEEAKENHILEEEDSTIYTHLKKVLIHMIDEQDAQILKSRGDCARNKRKPIQYLKYAEIWQSASVICSYAAFLCDILLIVTIIIFFIKYHKTMQAMLAAFISTNTSGIPPTKAKPIDRTFPPLFTINLPEEDQIVDDLEDIKGMQITIQAISFIICAISYYNIISDFQKMSIYAFNCKILLPILSDFENFERHS